MDNWILKQTIDLSNMEKIVRVWPEALLVAGDGLAHTWQVTVLNAGEPADLEGASVTAYFNRSDHRSVLATGTVEGNVISVDFPATAYAVAGAMYGILRITQTGGKVVTLSALRFMVMIGPYSETIDPGTVIPSIDDLLAEIEAMQEATADATSAAASATAAANAGVRTDQAQNLTDAQKLMGRTNIDAAEQTQIQRVMTERGGVDVLAFGNLYSNTSNGVTFTRNSDGTWTVTDTATATLAIHNFYYNLTVLPAWLIPGKTYPVKFETTAATPGNVRLQVWFYKNGVYMGDDVSKSFTASGTITVPSDAGGAIVRLVVNNGVTANETVTVGIYSAMSNAELEEVQKNDLLPLLQASDDIECLKVTYPLKGTYNGLSYEWEGSSTIKLWGTMTTSARRIVCFNGRNVFKTTSGDFVPTLEAGVYQMSITASGHILQADINYGLAYTYSTFSSAVNAVTRTMPSAEVVLDSEAMLGLTIIGSVDYGTEENPTRITVSAKWKTAIDRKARNDISGIKSSLGAERITEWIEDYYVVLNTATADPSAPVSSSIYRYAVVNCVPGGTFTISGTGGTAPKLWAFLDNSLNVLSASANDLTAVGEVIEAPAGAAWLVINDKDRYTDCYRGIAVQPGLERAMQSATGALTDADAAEDNRLYEITSGSVSNLPISGATGLLTSFTSGNAKMQLFTSSGFELYFRRKWNGIWSAWFQFAVQAVD